MNLGEDLLTLGILLVVAYVLGRLGKLIGLPSIPIYMIVGLLASPYSGWFPSTSTPPTSNSSPSSG
ncbi:hypothetical protein [Cryobacterium sp. PAMC25264]|uniref:hypothetical protein n=1 Tax=Cryobacterium sp. PAMC25264 TaxID=2861288 RepID=UPI0021020F9A|nr:hypothetical protein [Cryobacterium sp. PAMC25264]